MRQSAISNIAACVFTNYFMDEYIAYLYLDLKAAFPEVPVFREQTFTEWGGSTASMLGKRNLSHKSFDRLSTRWWSALIATPRKTPCHSKITMNNIAEQFEDLYSRWSLLDKAGKDAQLADMMGRAQGLYHFLVMNYSRKGFLTQDEYNQVEQIRQVGQYLQAQKIQADQDLWNGMMKHLAKMAIKR